MLGNMLKDIRFVFSKFESSIKEIDMTTTMTAPMPSGNVAIRRRSPLTSLRSDIEGFFNNFFEDGHGGLLSQSGMISPPLDITETEAALQVRMDLPGIEANEIDVQVSGNQLTIAGERKEEKVTKNELVHRVERRVGCFSRSIALPCAVQDDKIEANYQGGVLHVTLPKTDEAKSRRVPVKAR
jgi:HSP20 family protein